MSEYSHPTIEISRSCTLIGGGHSAWTHLQAPLKSELRDWDANYAILYQSSLQQYFKTRTYYRIDLIIFYCMILEPNKSHLSSYTTDCTIWTTSLLHFRTHSKVKSWVPQASTPLQVTRWFANHAIQDFHGQQLAETLSTALLIISGVCSCQPTWHTHLNITH